MDSDIVSKLQDARRRLEHDWRRCNSIHLDIEGGCLINCLARSEFPMLLVEGSLRTAIKEVDPNFDNSDAGYIAEWNDYEATHEQVLAVVDHLIAKYTDVEVPDYAPEEDLVAAEAPTADVRELVAV